MTRPTRPTCGLVEDRERPTSGDLEQRAAPTGAPTMDGPRLRGLIPYGIESRDLGGWREIIEPGALAGARTDDLVATVDHGGVPIARHPGTLTIEDRSDGMAWSLELPESRSDVREAVERGDLCAGSWRMVVARDEWRGNVRHVHEIAELRDVSVVSSPAYAASVVEHRSAPTPPAGPTPGPAQRPGLLRVEDRVQQAGPTLESRVVSALRSVNLGEARSLTTTSADAIVPDDQGTFVWDRLRAAAVMLTAGIRVVPTSHDSIVWPRITADVQPDWYSETELIVAGDPTFGTLKATPRKLAHRVELSNEVIDDSSPAIVDVLNAHLLGMLALKLDRDILEGNPAANSDSIRGLKFTSGIQTISMGTNGGALTNFDPLLAAVGLLRGANVNGPLVAVGHPRTVTSLALLKEATGSNKALEAPAGGPTIISTSQLSTTEAKGTATTTSSVYVFAPAEIVLVRRQAAVIELDRSRLFDRDMSELRAKARADLIVPNPAAVVRIDGITG